MLLNRLRTVVGADHGQYVVADANSGASFSFTTGGTGLVGPEGDIAVVGTGTAHGPVRLTIEAHDVQPDLDPDAWDEVVDVSVELPSAGLTIRMLMSGPAATVDLPTGGGAYWLRAQARGRDDARDDPVSADGEPAEEHLIVVWPAARLPDVPHAIVHKATDRVGAYFRHREGNPVSSTVEFRTPPAQWSLPDWVRWPDEPGVRVPVDPSPSPHADALRLSIAGPGRPPVVSAKAGEADSRRPDGPTLTGYWHGATVLRDHVVADHRAWLWPLPPADPLQLTVEWPGLDLSPVTVTLDAGLIATADPPRRQATPPG